MSSSRVTMKDIAAKLGVSVNTVHKAVANKPGVSDAVRAKVLLTADEMGYCRNESASVLRRRDLKVVVCLPSPEQENGFYFAYLWRGVGRYEAESRDRGMVFDARPFAIGDYAKALGEIISQAEAGECPEGMIAYAPVEPGTVELLTKISKLGVSVVLVDGDYPCTGRIGATVSCCSEAGSLMAEQAANLLPGIPGAKKILLLAGDPRVDSHVGVARAFHAYFDERGLDYAVCDLYGAHGQIDELRQKVGALLCGPDAPGLVCSVFAAGSKAVADVVMELGLVGKVRVIASDLFPENVVAMRRGIFTNIVCKDPISLAYRGARMLGEYLLRGEMPAASVLRGGADLVFRSNLDQYCCQVGIEA